MRRKFIAMAVVVGAITLTSCKKNTDEKKVEDAVETTDTSFQGQDEHTSQNSLDWSGTYQGTVPCADCEGIDLTLSLNEDGTFVEKLVYLGKEDNTFEHSGTFTWDETGSIIRLKQGDNVSQYKVKEGSLQGLDENGNPIEGPLASQYNLKKQ